MLRVRNFKGFNLVPYLPKSLMHLPNYFQSTDLLVSLSIISAASPSAAHSKIVYLYGHTSQTSVTMHAQRMVTCNVLIRLLLTEIIRCVHRPMVAAIIPRPPWCPTPGAEAYNNQLTYSRQQVCVVKIRNNNTYYYKFDYYVHNTMTKTMWLLATMHAAIMYWPSPTVPTS